MAIFAVRTRQIRDTSYFANGYIYQIGTVNNAIACPADFSCYAYYNDVHAGDTFFPFVQKARELSGRMIHPPTCSDPYAFCPDVPITRGQIAFYLVYGILGSGGLAPQQSWEGGSDLSLPPVTGVDCNGSVIYSNDIYLLSPQDYYSASSTRGTYADPSLWTMTVTASLTRGGATVFGQPAQPVKTDANSTLRFPSSGTAQLVPGNYLQTASIRR